MTFMTILFSHLPILSERQIGNYSPCKWIPMDLGQLCNRQYRRPIHQRLNQAFPKGFAWPHLTLNI